MEKTNLCHRIAIFPLLSFLIQFTSCTTYSPVSPEDLNNSSEFAQQVIELTNAERVKHGLSPLKSQKDLNDAAEWMAKNMAEHNYLDHTDRQGRSIGSRFPVFGYTNFSIIGENIAGGYASPGDAIAGWMNSTGHRANILNSNYREIGVGFSFNRSSRYGSYWTQDFGSRVDVFPVVINNEAAQTKSPEVNLYIYGVEWAEQMHFSNDSTNWTDWETYQTSHSWTLVAGSGERTVFVELRKGSTIRNSKDSILLSQ